MLRLADGRDRLYQWDADVRLRVNEPEGVQIAEVHFTNTVSASAAVVEVEREEDGAFAPVPNTLLQHHWDIHAYCVCPNECGGVTRACYTFEVEARQKPDDYVYTETEVKTWDELDRRIGELEENGGGTTPGGGAKLSDELPTMNGEASAGVSNEVSRADHTHPTDTTRMPAITEMKSGAVSDKSKVPFMDDATTEMRYLTWEQLIALANVAAYYYSVSSDMPLMDGEASAGTADKFSRSDHTHPTDITRMPADISGLDKLIARGRQLEDGDRLVIGDPKDQRPKYITWAEVIAAIAKYVNPAIAGALETAVVPAARAVCTEDGAVYALLPSGMNQDGVLALRSDIVAALADYFKKSETYSGDVIDNKIQAVIDGTQPKGDYALRSEIPLVPVQSVNGKTGAVQLTPGDIGAQAAGEYALSSDLAGHNTSAESHADIRLLIDGLSTAVENLLDVDEKTKEQLTQMIALIRDNAEDIEAVTNGKVNVTDIVDNLITNVADKPLSAAQGVVLKGLIDALSFGKLDSSTFNTSIANYYNKAQTESYVAGYAQPKGEYALKSELPTVPVKSVNGKTGAVQLVPSDIGAQEAGDYALKSELPTVPVKSVNGKTGAVQLSAGDVGAQPAGDYALRSELPSVPVQSVNGKTGAVQLKAPDVGAVPTSQTLTLTGVDENGTTHTWTVYGVSV